MNLATNVERPFVPGLGREWLLPLYDPLTAAIGINRARRLLVEHASLRAWHHVLDVGCGTGTLALMIKRRFPDAAVTGIDPDAKALVRGGLKAKNAGVRVQFDRGFGDALPYAEASFDRVLSSFMFHHLDRGEKAGMLREARRVLKPDGRLLLVDFAGRDAPGALGRRMHSHARLADNTEADVLGLMRDAGLDDARAVDRRRAFGGLLHVTYYEAFGP
jgi:ubiquinone/menaquinone biosynthesis C-methylase UbiE